MKVVTIDGPAASGKTSVSREFAKSMGWTWLSTGAFYRGLAYVATDTNTPLDDESALAELAASNEWHVQMDIEKTHVIHGGRDVTDHIYSEDVGSAASRISSLPKVRQSLLAAQRSMAQDGEWLIAEGRDCGTIVFPGAPLKFYLTARSDARAQRRAEEQGLDVEEIKRAQEQRDQQDATRKAAPMQVPEDAHVIDTSRLSLEEVVGEVKRISLSVLESI